MVRCEMLRAGSVPLGFSALDKGNPGLAQYAIDIWLPKPSHGPSVATLPSAYENKVTFPDTEGPVETAIILATKDPRHHPRLPRGWHEVD